MRNWTLGRANVLTGPLPSSPAPHVGHLHSMVLADVFKRFQTLKGREAYFCTGTDEHGMKVQRAAELQDVAPKIFCDSNAETFKDLAKKANLAHDHFVRTTDPDHRKAVEYFWEQLRRRGYIYETAHSGWYCVSDEAFYPESMVDKQVSTVTGKSYMACTETGNAVEWTEEKNYHFRLTALKDRLLDFLQKNPDWVVPATRMTEVVNWVKNNLEDLSISRPASRLSWGIPVPGDPDQTIYVWVDALVNYLTKSGYPQWDAQTSTDGGWPADVHIIGKDIVRFHCVYWPALLMALDLDLPRRVLSHGHWLMGRQKMSKSIGNVVNPFFAIDRWGVDTMRFFLMRNGGITYDADYDNSLIVTTYKKDLQGGLGGLLSRVTRSKLWDVGSIVERAHKVGPGFITDDLKRMFCVDRRWNNDLEDLFERNLDPSKALKSIMETIYHVRPPFGTETLAPLVTNDITVQRGSFPNGALESSQEERARGNRGNAADYLLGGRDPAGWRHSPAAVHAGEGGGPARQTRRGPQPQDLRVCRLLYGRFLRDFFCAPGVGLGGGSVPSYSRGGLRWKSPQSQ